MISYELMKVVLRIIKWFIKSIGPISAVNVTSDDKYIISGSFDKSIKIFDLYTRRLIHHFVNVHKGDNNLFCHNLTK